MVRRAHTKSRLGCRTCKQRKVKCDECKPTCGRCVSAGRHCSYLETIPDLPTPTSTLSATSRDERHLPTTPHLTPAANDATSSALDDNEQSLCLEDPSLTEESFSLLHLELLDHCRNSITMSDPIMQSLVERGYQQALRVPYLMDQVLALAAAHKSTTLSNDGDQRLQHFLRIESTKLQTRALSRVTFAPDTVNKDNADALYIFSMLLGHHVLFDTFSAPESLAATLNKLNQCFELHQSIRFTAAEALRRGCTALGIDSAREDYMAARPQDNISGTECAGLLERLRSADIDQATADVYCETVKILQYLFDSSKSSANGRRVAVVQEWLVRVPYEYITCLRQRRPESIVILAYYAVLLHGARHYWAVGEAGRFLIQATASHLGSYWTDWLAWPQQVLEND